MSVRQKNDGRRWARRAALALMPLLVIGATVRHALQEWAQECGQDECRQMECLRERTEERWTTFLEDFRLDSLPETRQAIDEAVVSAFAPVSAGIDPFLDWHYSFLGQSTQLILYVSGKIEDMTGWEGWGSLEDAIESRLFEGLEDRMDIAGQQVGGTMRDEVLSRLDAWLDQEEALLPRGCAGAEHGRILEQVRASTTRRFAVSIGPSVIVSGMAGVAASASVRAVSGRLAARLPALLRSAVARWMPASVAGWLAGIPVALAVDYVIRRIDGWLNRDELRQELVDLVDEERQRVKSAFVEAAAGSVKLDVIDDLGVFVPAELGRRPAP